MDFLGFLCKNDFFGCWPRKILVYRVKYFSDPPHIHNDTLEFFANIYLFLLFVGPLFRPRGGGGYFHLLMYTYARRIPGPGGLEPPLSKIDKNGLVISSTQLKLFCLTPSQRANLKMAPQHPSCSLSIKKGAVNKHSDWR